MFPPDEPGPPTDPILTEIQTTRADLERRLEEIREIERGHLETGGVGSAWLEYDTILRARSAHRDRLSTGISSLDSRIEGGLYGGTLTVVQGKPGIGKTMLATQIALNLGRTCAVGALFADEGLAGAAVRIGQQLGVPRADLMAGGGIDEALRALADTRPYFRFLDPSRAESNVEFLFEDFDRMAPAGMPRVILLDSAQVARTRRANPRMDRRQTVSTLLLATRDLALRHRAVAIVVSQVSRAAYRSKKEEDRIDPLAAGLETSGIEFMAELILHLDGKPTPENPAVTLRCPKNRLSAEGTFDLQLQMDFPRARFLEADAAAIEHDAAVAREAALRPVLTEIVKCLTEDFPDGATGRQIASEMGRRTADVVAALWLGVSTGVLVKARRAGRGGGSVYRAKS